jgi:hypothetical protein
VVGGGENKTKANSAQLELGLAIYTTNVQIPIIVYFK